ncbi:MAG: hypothetical protein ABSB40_09345 [Nitrososphaeria archaeon]|jgi:hypothetical protein
MSSHFPRVVYGVVGILVIVVVVLTGIVGYFYTQGVQTLTTTVSETVTVTVTLTGNLTNTNKTSIRFEELETTNAFINRNTNNYTITVSYQNSGSTNIAIENIFINEKTLNIFWNTATVNGKPMSNIYVPQGASGQIVVSFPDSGNVKAFIAGQTVEIKIQTASGVYYIVLYNIP